MYIIVNKATFRVIDAIKANIKNNIKLINTTSLSDSKLSCKVATQATYLIPIFKYYTTFKLKIQANKTKFCIFLYLTK